MATIIQPYSPWREQLAADIIVPFVSGMIKRNEERANNRLQNEVLQKLTIDAASDPAEALTALTDVSMPKMSGELSPWQGVMENELNQPVNKISAESINIKPSANARSAASQADMMARLANTLGDRRYSGLNPAAMYQLAQPYIAAAEQSRREAKLAEMANAIMGAGDDYGKWNTALGGVINGYVDPAALDRIAGMYQYNNPYMQRVTTDLGGSVMAENWNPRTGETAGNTLYPKTMSPDESARNALDWAKYGSSEDERKYEREHPKPNYMTLDDGQIYNLQDNTATPVLKEPTPYANSMEEYDYTVNKFKQEHPGWQIVESKEKKSKNTYGINPKTYETVFVAEVAYNAPKRGMPVAAPAHTGGNGGVTEKDRWNKTLDMLGEDVKTIRERRQTIMSQTMPGEEVPPDIKQQIADLDRQEAELMERMNAMLQGAYDARTSQPPQPQTETPESIIAATAADENGQTSPEAVAAVVPEVTQMREAKLNSQFNASPYSKLRDLGNLRTVSGDIAPQAPAAITLKNEQTGEVFAQSDLEEMLKAIVHGNSSTGQAAALRQAGVKDMEGLVKIMEANGFTRIK